MSRRGAVPRKRLFVRTRDGVEARFLIPHVDDRVAPGLPKLWRSTTPEQ